MNAAKNCRLDKMKTALDRGVDVNARDDIGWTALHEAVYCSPDVVEWLMIAGAEINARDIGGNTPLHLAASIGAMNIVETLIAHGADASLKNDDGLTADMRALEAGHATTAALLVKERVPVGPIVLSPFETSSSSALNWGEGIEAFVSGRHGERLERGQDGEFETLIGQTQYLGYPADITYGFIGDRGLLMVGLYIDETEGRAYRAIFDHLSATYECEWAYEVEQFWIGPKERIYVVLDVIYGTQIFFVEREYADEIGMGAPGSE